MPIQLGAFSVARYLTSRPVRRWRTKTNKINFQDLELKLWSRPLRCVGFRRRKKKERKDIGQKSLKLNAKPQTKKAGTGKKKKDLLSGLVILKKVFGGRGIVYC